MSKLAFYVFGFGSGTVVVNLVHALWLHSYDYIAATIAMVVITILGTTIAEANTDDF